MLNTLIIGVKLALLFSLFLLLGILGANTGSKAIGLGITVIIAVALVGATSLYRRQEALPVPYGAVFTVVMGGALLAIAFASTGHLWGKSLLVGESLWPMPHYVAKLMGLNSMLFCVFMMALVYVQHRWMKQERPDH